ncbi:MAG: hypothetical protein WD872_00635 [Pirellulaceae bacterium]
MFAVVNCRRAINEEMFDEASPDSLRRDFAACLVSDCRLGVVTDTQGSWSQYPLGEDFAVGAYDLYIEADALIQYAVDFVVDGM